MITCTPRIISNILSIAKGILNTCPVVRNKYTNQIPINIPGVRKNKPIFIKNLSGS